MKVEAEVKNNLLIDALLKKKLSRPPIWLMRQAGRYLPEYRQVRKEAKTFLNLCKTPELACEVTLQPISRFGFDAAIIFSDILTVPEAMGLELEFVESEGPIFHNFIKTEEDIDRLDLSVIDKLSYVFDAVNLTSKSLDIPLLGFSGSPWTIATYMLEGKGSKNFAKANKWKYKSPNGLHKLLNKITEVTIKYLNEQIKAGASAVMIFDTWGGILNDNDYKEFSLKYMEQIVNSIITTYNGKRIPNIVFSKNAGRCITDIVNIGSNAMGVDYLTDIAKVRNLVEGKIALQGNLEPSALYADYDVLDKKIDYILNSMKGYPGFVFNLGHGILPDIECEKVKFLVDKVKSYNQ